jgi:hypothetical protein
MGRLSPLLTKPILAVMVLVGCYAIINQLSHSHTLKVTKEPPSPWKPPSRSEIPNIIHYIHVLPPPEDNAARNRSLEFEFPQFISFYSAHLYLQPEKIYIHTNAAPESIEEARQSLNQWTYAIANLPTVEFRYEEAPTETTTGWYLEALAHRADFMRTRVLKRMGGIYLDEDIYILKDLTPLRLAGFHNVVGRQYMGGINNGMILSTPASALITAFDALQNDAFDGQWATHSIDLLTRLVSDFAPRHYEVLVMEQDAFFPLDWETGVDVLYGLHGDEEPENEPEPENPHSFNSTTYIADPLASRLQPTWACNWSVSYALHGWKSALVHRGHLFGKYGGISLGYVLARDSNFARAVYPAVKHALDNGVIKIS